MMGKNHIICTLSMVSTILVSHDFIYKMSPTSDLDWLQNLNTIVWSKIGLPDDVFMFPNFIRLVPFILFVLFGTLFTDCDSKKSILGKIIYIPIKHRRWLHAIWIPALCFFAGLSFAPSMWFSIGWFLHEFMDSFSYAGNSYLYPIVGYNEYGDAFVKKGIHNFKLYRTGERSETIFVVCVVFLCVLLDFLLIYASFYDINNMFDLFRCLYINLKN
jgi:membrane-bound metal-dependent hydrolase YbcI (DUF457 family)